MSKQSQQPFTYRQCFGHYAECRCLIHTMIHGDCDEKGRCLIHTMIHGDCDEKDRCEAVI